MGMLDHWHPLVLSADLKKNQAVAVRLAGREIAVYRTRGGEVAALDNVCPHRRMRLSLGTVVGEKLQCKYHGWTFNGCGAGESPGTPKLTACVGSYDVREAHGAVWVKPRDADAVFPEIGPAGYHFMCVLEHALPAPLETAVDNFTEIEHRPTTHALFGYPLERMHEVTVKFETTPTSVRVINVGPSKPVPFYLRLMLGITPDYQFIDDWTTYFSPVYSVYDHEWVHPKTGKKGWVGWKLYMFVSPVSEKESRVTTIAYARSLWPGPTNCLRPMRGFMKRLLDLEIKLDAEILAGLADADPSLEGMKLSRFDRALGLNRERIRTIYRGEAATLRSVG